MSKNNIKHLIILSGLLIILLIVFTLSISIGEINIPFISVLNTLLNSSSDNYDVLHHIRIPRTLLAFAIGGSLSLSGVILQGIYRNPLVEPYTLGISGGASVGVALAIVSGLYLISKLIVPLMGFVGALITIFLVYTLSKRKYSVEPNRMLLIGVMISFIASSLVTFLMSITTIENIGGIVFWTMGSLNETHYLMVNGIVITSILALFISYFFMTPLNALRLGESKAKQLGVNTQLSIQLLFILTSILTGCCIAIAGVIGFVGLIIPHVSRRLVGLDYKILLITSFLSGSIFLILCDILSRRIIAPNELPIGVITGIVGGITFIFILNKTKKR